MSIRNLLFLFLFLNFSGYSVLAQSGSTITGSVRNPQNDVVVGATVSVYDEKQILFKNTTSDTEGQFVIENLPIGSYEIVVEISGFAAYRKAVRIASGQERLSFDITLQLTALNEGITVTAVVNEVQDVFESSQQIGIITKEEISQRSGVIFPQVIQEEVGLMPRQASTNQGSIVVRGLSGQRVVTLIDGVRFNNSTFNTGGNQYLGLIDSSILSRVEVVHGPGSAQYGSDALGGTINVLSERPKFFSSRFDIHGELNTFFGSADLSSGGNVKVSLGNSNFSFVLSGFGRRVNDLRPGGGLDSHAFVTRAFGVSSQILGDRLKETAFSQFGGFGKLIWKPKSDQQFSLFYHRSDQRNVRRYDLLNGGSAAIIANFTPQVLEFLYTRYEKQGLGLLDSLTGTFSFNRLRDNFQLQFGNQFSSIFFDFSRRDSFGYLIQGTSHIGSQQFLTFGAELYDERLDNAETQFNPINNDFQAELRAAIPNGAKYQSYGVYLQDSADLIPNRLLVNGGIRYSAFFSKTFSQKNPLGANNLPTVLDTSLRTDDVTFNFGASLFITPYLNLTTTISRGFRAPNLIDLGSLGFTSGGFEVTAKEAAFLGGIIGSTAGLNTRSTGRKVTDLGPEKLLNYEVGLKLQKERFYSTFTFYRSDVSDFVLKRALILPPGAVGKTIGGQVITSQDPVSGQILLGGSVSTIRPVVVTVNAGEVLIYGIETTSQFRITDSVVLSGNFSYIRGEDQQAAPLPQSLPGVISIRKAPNAPDIRGGLPPARGFLGIRYQPAGKRYWLEVFSNMASYQDRFSSADLADPSIGATRSRGLIAFFFANRARVLGLVGNGKDGRANTADDILLATGETLPQIQDRVLGRGVISAPFTLSTPGYATLNLRGGLKLNETSDLTVILENILDKNYRLHGSGVDAPGINLVVRYSVRF